MSSKQQRFMELTGGAHISSRSAKEFNKAMNGTPMKTEQSSGGIATKPTQQRNPQLWGNFFQAQPKKQMGPPHAHDQVKGNSSSSTSHRKTLSTTTYPGFRRPKAHPYWKTKLPKPIGSGMQENSTLEPPKHAYIETAQNTQ
eukprot:CAMPEP_0117444072 /NCGR_PEP_ID=MMETSP0759-20121206/5040_1 /TAXON_ID=63605 /ORGANISM="Percolomonas cosmopolitus, Strain WS" /LENGTH=141 /DNA_ID=CAMNT_0005236103 /DNA_START=87 /DNA_END=509 /DNA_ORIENTATION=+